MATKELFYVIPFKNPSLDDSMHYMVFHPPENKVEKFLKIFLVGHRNIQIDLTQKFVGYESKAEAEGACQKLGDVANQINPDRIDASTLTPPNRALEPGKVE